MELWEKRIRAARVSRQKGTENALRKNRIVHENSRYQIVVERCPHLNVQQQKYKGEE